jgi:hypothetical protein
MAEGGEWVRRGTRVLATIAGGAAVLTTTLFILTRHLPAPGDIAQALSQRPGTYLLSLDHMKDLTFPSLAYLRFPLEVASLAFLLGFLSTVRAQGTRAFLGAALMMVLFFHAARLALVIFDPYLSSRALAEALEKAPPGTLIVDHHYYTYSSIFFYTNRTALLLNGRFNNLEYGAYAPQAPDVFINDAGFQELWLQPERRYLVASPAAAARLKGLVGETLHLVAESGGKLLLTNHPLAAASAFKLRPPPARSAPSPRPSEARGRGEWLEPTYAVLGWAECSSRPSARIFGNFIPSLEWNGTESDATVKRVTQLYRITA